MFIFEIRLTGQKGSKRADIFVLDTCTAIEIMESEDLKSIEKKRKEYPCPIIAISTRGEFKKELWT